jgi:hypothetical protein
MTTPLKAPTTIGSKIASVVVQSVTVHASGAVLADWQGLDAQGSGVVRQNAAFVEDAAALLRAAPAGELVTRAEAAIVQAIASGGEAPPQNLPSSGPKPIAGVPSRPMPPQVAAALAGARAKHAAKSATPADLHPGRRNGSADASATVASTSPAPSATASALPASHPYAAAAAQAAPVAPSPAAAAPEPVVAAEDVAELPAPAELAPPAVTVPAPAEAPPVYPPGHPYAPPAAPVASPTAPTEPPVPPEPPTEPLPELSAYDKAMKVAGEYGAGMKR